MPATTLAAKPFVRSNPNPARDAAKEARAAEMAVVWRQYKADPTNKALRNRLVEEYLPLVKYNGERIWSRLPDGVELDDLISAGVFGLMDAINAFDMDRGVKFETYCVPRIRGAMLDELRSMDWVPRLVRSKASKLNEAIKQLETKHGRAPTEVELAEHMEMSVPELEKMMQEANAVGLISLNKKWYETDSLQGRPRDRHPRGQEVGRPDAPRPEVGPHAAGDQGPQPQRAAHHHPLLLRGADDEGDRRHARPLREPRQPDALGDRPAAAGPAGPPPPRVRRDGLTASGCR